ncbi:hypothetical protein EBO23_04175 [Micrococcus luteus]|uniref:Uncharacterized protein n=1 Tax=Micrococcus luteus TaxID=1270 RepID=A0AAX0VI65_MICLU|nr:hypothetical protein [Micrococcus luteus]MCT2325215.1 hypothetical protein [Micrococcus luteus]MCV7750612.1 hypothetical protein [Micrococcus luteus]PKZ80691.1 hypothetical protein CYJ95_10720 [Micrococcus luteus]TPE34977.1 hypothetical protein EBO23_04175 [Micrococcus luteus]
MPRTFSARDRRALTGLLTAGLKHAQLDDLTAARPVPGDPGHDSGKAGRVGLIVATWLASGDHTGLTSALELLETAKLPPARHADLARLQRKAGLDSTPQPTSEAEPEGTRTADGATEPPLPAEEAAPPASPRHVPLVLLQDLAEDHPAVQALLAAGLEVGHLEHTSTIPADALLLHPAHEI